MITQQRRVIVIGHDADQQPMYRYFDELMLPVWERSEVDPADLPAHRGLGSRVNRSQA